MKNTNEDRISISPVKNYNAPKIPTIEDTRKKNPSLLKKLPLRWQKNAAVIACMGFVGTVTLSGCVFSHLFEGRTGDNGTAPVYVTNPQIRQEALEDALAAAELNLRTHWGGGGWGPFYVVHITEQEAFAIVRAKLEAEGLNFSADTPEYVVETWFRDFGIDLYDEEKGVAIAQLTWDDNNQPFFSHGGNHLAEEITERFAEQTDIHVGVFFNPGQYLGMAEAWWGWEDDHREGYDEYQPPTAEMKEEAKEALLENLTGQVQKFIDFLRSEGVI